MIPVWPLVLIDDVFNRQVVDFKMLVDKAEFVIIGRMVLKSKIRNAASQGIDCLISTYLKTVTRSGAPNNQHVMRYSPR